MKKKIKNKNKGFMAVEVLVAVSILTIFILVAMAVAQKSVYVSRQALHATQAAFLLEGGAENARIARDNAWSNVLSLSTSEQFDIFTRTVVSSDVCRNTSNDDISPAVPCGEATYNDARTKLITVTVSWPEGGITITKTLRFYLTDIFS
jgi:Tfp pilus assembly protein PilV